MPPAERERLLELDVVRIDVERDAGGGLVARDVVVKDLQARVGELARVIPAAEHVVLREVDIGLRPLVEGRALHVALQREAAGAGSEVGAESALYLVPAIAAAGCVFELGRPAIESLRVDAIRTALERLPVAAG